MVELRPGVMVLGRVKLVWLIDEQVTLRPSVVDERRLGRSQAAGNRRHAFIIHPQTRGATFYFLSDEVEGRRRSVIIFMLRGCVILLAATGLVMGQAMVQHAAAAAGGAAAAASSKKIADGLEKILGGAANTAAVAAAPTPLPPVPKPAASSVAGKRGKPSPFEPQVNRAGGTEMAPSVPRGAAGIPSPTEVEAIVSGESVPNNAWTPRKQTHQAAVPAFTPFVSNDAPAASRGSRRGGDGNGDTMMLPPTVSMPVAMIATAIIPPLPPPVRATLEKLAGIQLGANYETILSQLGTPAARIEMMDDGKVFESLRIEANGSKLGTIQLVNGVVTSVEPVVR